MQSLDQILERESKTQGNYAKKGQYLSIAEKQKIQGILHDSTLPFYKIFKDPTYGRYETKPSGENVSWKLGTTFIVVPEMEPKAYEMSFTVWAQLRDLIKEHGKDSVFQIRRIDKKTYVVDFVRKATEEETAKVLATEPFVYTYTDTQAKKSDSDSMPSTPPSVGEDVDDELFT